MIYVWCFSGVAQQVCSSHYLCKFSFIYFYSVMLRKARNKLIAMADCPSVSLSATLMYCGHNYSHNFRKVRGECIPHPALSFMCTAEKLHTTLP